MAGEWKDRLSNMVATPVRMAVWAPAHALVDLNKTGIGYYKDTYDIAMETTNEIQETISAAGAKWKWYHKAANIWIIAPLWSAAKLITWSIQTAVNPIVNGVFNFAKTWWGFLKNEFNGIKSVFSKKPVSDFSFEKLKLTPTRKSWRHPKNFLIGWAAWAAVVATSTPETTPAPQAVVAQAPTPVEDSETKKIISELAAKSEKQEKTNQELQNTIVSMQEQSKKQTQLMEQQSKQHSELIATLQANNTKQIAKDATNNEVEEKLDSPVESPKKKVSKKQPVA